MSRNMILGAVLILSAAGVSFGQEVPKPGPEHEKMKELEGTWDAVMDMGGQKTPAKSVYKSICGGMWLESDFEGSFGESKFQGHGFDGYDQIKKKYVGVWVDSMSSKPMHFEGDLDPKTNITTMKGESVDPEGNTVKFKTTTHRKDKDHFTFAMFMILPDGKEHQSFTIEYTRRK